MYKSILVLLVLFLFACSKSYDENGLIQDQYGGDDLLSQLSQDEILLLGKWYYAYRMDEYANGTINTHYESSTNWNNPTQTDTIIFFSNQFVGISWTCPLENPPLLDGKLIKLVESRSPNIMNVCFGTPVNGWLIENDSIIHYRGVSHDDIFKYPIEELNNDSLVFAYYFSETNIITKRTATFYKD